MKTLLTFFFLIVVNVVSLCQVSEEKYNFTLLSLDYSSNTNTFGLNVLETKQPNLISSITFASKTNFDISYIGIATSNADTTLTATTYEHDLMLAYNINISDDFIIYPAYTHLFHSKKSYAFNSAFKDIFQIDLMLYKKHLNSSLSLNYMLGEKNMVYTSFQNALEIDFDDVLIKNSNLNIQLGFILNVSDKNYYNKTIYDSWGRESFISWVYNNYRNLTLIVNQSINSNGLEYTKNELYEKIEEVQPEVFGKSYALSSIDVYLPIFYSIKSFMFNFTASLNVPLISNSFYESEISLSISTGISYSFTF